MVSPIRKTLKKSAQLPGIEAFSGDQVWEAIEAHDRALAVRQDDFEVHLFDFTGDLYGKTLRVALVDFIRPEMKFAGLDQLKAQIAQLDVRAENIANADTPGFKGESVMFSDYLLQQRGVAVVTTLTREAMPLVDATIKKCIGSPKN